MALNSIKGLGRISKYFINSRTVLATNTKSSFRVGESITNARTITRSLFFLSGNRDSGKGTDQIGAIHVAAPWSNTCSCECSMHTKGDKELAAFLEEEIANETNAYKYKVVSELGEFMCKYDEAEVSLSKKLDHETVTIKANVNHSVDSEDAQADPSEAKEGEMAEMISKPEFTVEVSKNNKVLSFQCTFADAPIEEGQGGDAYNDSFQITEVSFYEGEFGDKTYAISGDVMDGYLYDLLMNYLEERGVSNQFVDKLVKLFTSYEHKMYVNLLQRMKSFVEK